MNQQFALWGGFTLFILAMLALDLGLFQRKPHVIGMKEAMAWFGVWIALALIFNIGVILFYGRGGEAGLEFFTGFLVEKSLSIDNITFTSPLPISTRSFSGALWARSSFA